MMTANGEVRTNKDATVYFKQLDLFVTVMLLEKNPAVFSLGKLCKDHGGFHTTGPAVRIHISSKTARELFATNPPFGGSSFISEVFLYFIFTYFSIIVITRFSI